MYVKIIRPILPHVLAIVKNVNIDKVVFVCLKPTVLNVMLRLGYRGFTHFKNSSINNPPPPC